MGYKPETGTITNAFSGLMTSSDFQNPFVNTDDADTLHSNVKVMSTLSKTI